MKILKISFIILFFVLLMIPVVLFNHEPNAVSEIDNRMLSENPITLIKNNDNIDLTQAIENYLDDRIGLRNEMIKAYVLANDSLFHEMMHPSYEYGKDGYVFFKSKANEVFGDYHIAFADMIKKIQDYCESRDVPFLFVFNPAKISVLRDKLDPSWNYNNDWVAEFKNELDKRNINYIDNTVLLTEKTEQGEAVFNKQYDAGHWNDLGAFYGVNNILNALQADFPDIHINSLDEFNVNEALMTSLPVSEFSINEMVPDITTKASLINLTDEYSDEVKRADNYRTFMYYINETRQAEGTPKTLVFQGSYMNGRGYKFLQNALGEYIAVHDYWNVLNFDYYYQIFKPECVVFEVAEYTFNSTYFPYEDMLKVEFNPPLYSFNGMKTVTEYLKNDMYSIVSGDTLSTIAVHKLPEDTKYAYALINGEEFDLIYDDESGCYNVSIEKKRLTDTQIEIISVSALNITHYKKAE